MIFLQVTSTIIFTNLLRVLGSTFISRILHVTSTSLLMGYAHHACKSQDEVPYSLTSPLILQRRGEVVLR